MKQELDVCREEVNRKFESADVETRTQRNHTELLEERLVEMEEWSTVVHDTVKTSLEQQRQLQEHV